MKILTVVGARPNFVKVAPLCRAYANFPEITSKIVHTGQHSDYLMSGIFFKQLELPEPDYFLNVGGGSQTVQTADIMLAFEEVVNAEKPDLIVVVGDVTSTLACALVAVKMGVRLAHVEAGLRSGDRKMPEEINRILTDCIADMLFVTEESAFKNLLAENIPPGKIHFAGNVMIDSLVHLTGKIDGSDILNRIQVNPDSYSLLTLHRPSNVDRPLGLKKMLEMIKLCCLFTKILLPLHPRTRRSLEEADLWNELSMIHNLTVLEPLGYIDFIHLVKNALLVITDSGGIQEETTFLQIPCLTLRKSTERLVTVEEGTNMLLPEYSPLVFLEVVAALTLGKPKITHIPAFWDGKAAERIVATLREKYINS